MRSKASPTTPMVSKKHVAAATLALTWITLLVATKDTQEQLDNYTNAVHRKLNVPLSKVIVDENGILQVRRKPETPPCNFFTNYSRETQQTFSPEDGRQIKGLHFHFDDCAENQLGNRLGEHYLNYLLANSARIPYHMSCGDTNDYENHSNNVTKAIPTVVTTDPTSALKAQHESVLRHLHVHLMEPGPQPHDPWGGQSWAPENLCQHCSRGGWWCPIGLNAVIDVIRQDMLKLVNTSVGQSFEPDDAVIHLRLGDALRGTKDEHIGLLPHQTYEWILQSIEHEQGPIKTIGIVTQPFKRELVRSFDVAPSTISKSKLVAYDLVDYLQTKFPNATITIHNGPDEIPLKSYARLLRANKVAVCGPSTFCTMPVLAMQTAIGYIFRGEKHSPWAKHVAQFSDNIRTYKVPRLANNYTDKLNDEEILFWLRNQLPHVGDFTINGPPLVRNEVPVQIVLSDS
ncbi:hypothetical protein MHU86_20837 [Fragilaria crotonensis]|nr:hypothetical protein MHU86_20837 [Fragilaria crotonensis]